jgi:hypothetical protein
MTNAPKDDDKLPEAEAESRFNRLVGKLVNTPHQPHKVADGNQGKPKKD